MIGATLRYFPVQLRDRLLARGVWMLVIAAALMLEPLLRDYSGIGVTPERVLSNAIQGMLVFIVLIGAYGVIGQDVQRGYFRNVFSKPVSPVLYYLQELLTVWLAAAMVTLLAIGAYAVVREPVWPSRALTESAFAVVLLSALVLGGSRVLGQLDWLVGVALFAVGGFIRQMYPPGESLGGAVFNVVLPPSHLVTAQSERLVSETGVAWDAALWVLGYAAAWVGLGLLSVRLLAFGTQRS